MLHTLRFSLQNAVYFIMLPFLVRVLFTFYIQGVLKFKCKIPFRYDNGRQPETYVNPEAANTVFELLMMSDVSLETC
jgi:hypothetical protein